MSQPNNGPSDISIRIQEYPGDYTVLSAYQGEKHETVLLRSLDLRIDEANYKIWLAELA